MRLTLRVLLAHLHGLLPAAEAEGLAERIAASPTASELFDRLRRLSAPDALTSVESEVEPACDDNTLAEYLDNALAPDEVVEFEQRLLQSDALLAEVVTSHRLLAGYLGESSEGEPALAAAMYALAPPEPATIAPTAITRPPEVDDFTDVAPPPIYVAPAAATPPPLVTALAIDPVPVWSPTENAALLSIALDAAEIEAAGDGHANALRFSSSWLVSAISNTIVIVLLGIWVVPTVALQAPVVLQASMPADDLSDPPSELTLPDRTMVIEPSLAPALSLSEPLPPSLTTPANVVASASMTPRRQLENVKLTRELPAEAMSTSATTATSSKRPERPRSVAAEGGVTQAANPGDAVDNVLKGIRREMENGDLLVVWLLDASLSLVDDRQLVAARIEPFYQELNGRQQQSHKLMNAVVAYGATTQELIEPTQFGLRTVEAVAKVPIDPTGLENVMTAIEQCVYRYRQRWRSTIQIVVWTDESGDDILRLEEIIALCRKQNVIVTVVGPSAVFGAERGSHYYRDLATGYEFLLPIKRGPDTSLPERLMLPYWHDSDRLPWTRNGAQIARGIPWYGGLYRERLLSGVGPYALTRLAMETGGRFLLLDREADSGPIRFEAVRQYLPDYQSAAEFMHSLKYHPLRAAVLDVVQMTYAEPDALLPPVMRFHTERNDEYPFNIFTFYETPNDFRNNLPLWFTEQTVKLTRGAQLIERCLARLEFKGAEREYEREESPRWRAWYDLTRGRLLALSARNVEYVTTCQLVAQNRGMLNADTNCIRLVPSMNVKSTQSQVLLRVAEAKKLLERCVRQNPGTPWALLAQWELEKPLGLDVNQIVVPPPRPGPPRLPGAPVPALPAF
ncbi:MAG: VWA domain-containing protein [Planctomycetes bacterium]|nr:VWA domain-containing protein [Planctomycetota bacterium]